MDQHSGDESRMENETNAAGGHTTNKGKNLERMQDLPILLEIMENFGPWMVGTKETSSKSAENS